MTGKVTRVGNAASNYKAVFINDKLLEGQLSSES